MIKKNKALYEDVKRVLRQLEGLPIDEARIVLKTALDDVERYSFLNLDTYTEKNEVTDYGE